MLEDRQQGVVPALSNAEFNKQMQRARLAEMKETVDSNFGLAAEDIALLGGMFRSSSKSALRCPTTICQVLLEGCCNLCALQHHTSEVTEVIYIIVTGPLAEFARVKASGMRAAFIKLAK